MLGQVLQGKNLRWLKTFEDNHFGALLTDPPYGYRFMDKHWDYQVPTVHTWKQVLRVLRPGAHGLVACGTRTYHRMAINIEDAGFEIRDVLTWHYAQGFPKSLNISKELRREPMERMERVAGVKVGQLVKQLNGWTKAEGLRELSSSQVMEGLLKTCQRWAGWGTALKPATEFWVLVRKPLTESSIADNILRWGTGAINIDKCRIPFENENDYASATYGTGINIKGGNFGPGTGTLDPSRKNIEANQDGRWPANALFDPKMAEVLNEQSGVSRSGRPGIVGIKAAPVAFHKDNRLPGTLNIGYGDMGGASRFFYCPKPSQDEKNAGLRKKALKNTNPCVKPIALMRYLARLITPPSYPLLDPYGGSGSTGCAAEMENLSYTLIEQNREDAVVANARCLHWHRRGVEARGQTSLFI